MKFASTILVLALAAVANCLEDTPDCTPELKTAAAQGVMACRSAESQADCMNGKMDENQETFSVVTTGCDQADANERVECAYENFSKICPAMAQMLPKDMLHRRK